MSHWIGANLANALWLLVVVGWIVMLLGLKADKPVSSVLPGQVARPVHAWHVGDQIGEKAGWALFGTLGLLLPFVLYWVLAARG